jgi:hypothetical protein
VLDAAGGQLPDVLDQRGRLACDHALAMGGLRRALAGPEHADVVAERERRKRRAARAQRNVLELDSQRIMREPWEHRRTRLEDLFGRGSLPRVGLVPVSEDAAGLYATWVGMGGEGIVLKARASAYQPGVRSPAWLKLKPKVTLAAVVTGGSARPIPWGDWGMAVMLELRYGRPRTGDLVEIRQALRIRRDEPFDLRIGARAEIICWGVMPSGMLRHPRFVRWVGDERGRTSGQLTRGACERSGARP